MSWAAKAIRQKLSSRFKGRFGVDDFNSFGIEGGKGSFGVDDFNSLVSKAAKAALVSYGLLPCCFSLLF